MASRCHAEVVDADGYLEACGEPATSTSGHLDEFHCETTYPTCDEHWRGHA